MATPVCRIADLQSMSAEFKDTYWIRRKPARFKESQSAIFKEREKELRLKK